jgi:hypothetical protein
VIDLGNGVKLIRRSEWGARPPRSRQAFTPSFGVTSHWEGPHMGTFSHASCFAKVRGIQAFHMDERGWVDLAYTGLPCPHGYVFEGRWIGVRTAANGTNAGNASAYALCYLGGEGDPFTEGGRRAMRAAAEYLDNHGGAGEGRNCHGDWKPTACPGSTICGWVRQGLPVTTTTPTPTPGGLSVADADDIMTELRSLRALVNTRAERTQVGDRFGGVIGRVEQMRQAVARYHREEMARLGEVIDDHEEIAEALAQLRSALPTDDSFQGQTNVPVSAIRTLVAALSPGETPEADEPPVEDAGAVEAEMGEG